MGSPTPDAYLEIRTGGFAGTRFPLRPDENLIGRNPNTDITLLDEAVSREHAVVMFDPAEDRYVIEDLQSSNGTHVNGKRVRTETLRSGDELLLGTTRFRFRCAGEAPADEDETVRIS